MYERCPSNGSNNNENKILLKEKEKKTLWTLYQWRIIVEANEEVQQGSEL